MIRAILLDTIMTYMAGNYRASRMILSVLGNIDEAAVLAESQFGQRGGVLRPIPGAGPVRRRRAASRTPSRSVAERIEPSGDDRGWQAG
jgi:predicted Zn-dependent peptidase